MAIIENAYCMVKYVCYALSIRRQVSKCDGISFVSADRCLAFPGSVSALKKVTALECCDLCLAHASVVTSCSRGRQALFGLFADQVCGHLSSFLHACRVGLPCHTMVSCFIDVVCECASVHVCTRSCTLAFSVCIIRKPYSSVFTKASALTLTVF